MIAGRAKQRVRQRGDIHAAIQNIPESSDGYKSHVDLAAALQSEDLHIGDMALVHEPKIYQSDCAKLYARGQGPYRVTPITLRLGIYQLSEQDRAHHRGRTHGNRLQKVLTRKDGIHGAQELRIPNSNPEQDSQEFKQFEMEGVADGKCILGWWMYFMWTTIPDHHYTSTFRSKPNLCQFGSPGCQYTRTANSDMFHWYCPTQFDLGRLSTDCPACPSKYSYKALGFAVCY